MLLVVTYTRAARQTLRNVVTRHETAVVERFGRAALLAETELGAFLALRLREKHGSAVAVERTGPFNEFETVPESVRVAAGAYEDRDEPALSYAVFAGREDHPTAETMAGEPLDDG